jgi:hypothetical protein
MVTDGTKESSASKMLRCNIPADLNYYVSCSFLHFTEPSLSFNTVQNTIFVFSIITPWAQDYFPFM